MKKRKVAVYDCYLNEIKKKGLPDIGCYMVCRTYTKFHFGLNQDAFVVCQYDKSWTPFAIFVNKQDAIDFAKTKVKKEAICF